MSSSLLWLRAIGRVSGPITVACWQALPINYFGISIDVYILLLINKSSQLSVLLIKEIFALSTEKSGAWIPHGACTINYNANLVKNRNNNIYINYVCRNLTGKILVQDGRSINNIHPYRKSSDNSRNS